VNRRSVLHPKFPFSRRPAAFAASAIWAVAIWSCLAFGPVTAGAAGAAASASSSGPAVKGGGPGWGQLSPAQRQALSPLEKDWGAIDANRKAKWLEIAMKYPKMPPAEQQRVQERMAEWARLSPAERGRARLSFTEAQQLSPEERKQRWEAYQSLSAEDRKALAARAAAASGPKVPPSRPSTPVLAATPKQNLVASSPAAGNVQPIGPTMVQAKPGATTTPVTKSVVRPVHQQPGQPKIAAKPGQVDRATLLPRAPSPPASAQKPSASSAPQATAAEPQ